ncbi:AAA family ATPase [Treponema sp. OMZ 840]|uniref:ATP-dependent DNA helicase n=1 Tax=Treponema sp. OMZ 840 TaxID=244313 RepID=UPI003D904028
MENSKNITVRVPWHDNGWKGTVCNNPQNNFSCKYLKGIAENKNCDFECPLASKKFIDLTEKDTEKIPCIKENAAFLSEVTLSFMAEYPYSSYSDLGHIKPTKVDISPNSLISRPYRWLRTEDSPASYIINYSKKREEEYKLSHKSSSNYPINKIWINEPQNQKAVLEYYYDGLNDNSLIVPYLKNVPFTEDNRRVVLGIGFVKSVHDTQVYNSFDVTKKITPYLWDKIIEHDIVNNGFVFPYKELYDYWQSNSQSNIDKYIIFADDDYRDQFSNGSELISYDALISILKQAKKCYKEISTDIPAIIFDYNKISNWIDTQIERLQNERGIYPALGTLLLSSEKFTIKVDDENKNIALDIIKNISFDGTQDSVSELNKAIDNYNGDFSTTQKAIAKRYIQEKVKIIKNLSRFICTEKQFKDILKNESKYGDYIDNPYLLFENSLQNEFDLQIPLTILDNGMFFNLKKQKNDNDLVIIEADSKERLRAFLIRELDEQAQNYGHTTLPVTRLVELINARNLTQDLHFDSDSIELFEDFLKEKIIIKEIEGTTYLKLKSIEQFDEVAREEIEERVKSGKITLDIDCFKNILKDKISKFEGNDTEKGKLAEKEKLESLTKLARNRISVLIGDAGTGKTTVLSALCAHSEISTKVLLLAPTGKARVRMWNATGKQYESKTIAGFLIADKNYNWNTGRYLLPKTSKVELSDSTVIIDESSMLTTEMFAAVLKASSCAKRIIFVGDPNQLPPIGCGKPFSDLVDYFTKEYPSHIAKLTQTMRSNISETNDFASWFKSNSNPDESVLDSIEKKENNTLGICFRKYEDEELNDAIIDEIVKVTGMIDKDDVKNFDKSLGAVINGQYTNFNCGGFFGVPIDKGAGSKAEAWQILTPVKNSPDGIYNINEIIHEKYRPTHYYKFKEVNNYNSEVCGLQKIGVGDKVICTKNGDSIAYPNSNFNYVANGEIGIRVGIKKGTYYQNVEFSTQLGVTYYGKTYRGKTYDWQYYGDDADGDLELAYAITVHKAQGSQFNNVILVLNRNNRMLSRELLYTAITRQQNGLVILYNDEFRNLLRFSSDEHSDLARRCTDLFTPPKFINIENKGWYEEGKIHRTKTGVMVRSKSEVIIANELENAGLDWHYENDGNYIEINGNKYLPDFVIFHNGKTYYWEHLGLRNDEDYEKRWEKKEKDYLSDKKIILKTTQDQKNGGIDSEDILSIIQEIKLSVE